MNNISFDVEIINGNTDYIYRFKQGAAENEGMLLNEFVHRMVINNYIKCFVPYTYEISEGHRHLRYSISPQPVLSDFLRNRFTDISACAEVIVNILKAIKTAEEYMIDRRFLLFNADYMFINKSDNSISLMCIPVITAENGSLSEFMRSIIMPLNFEGLPNSDTLKVTVYQYAFDTETTENAIAYFSDFCKKSGAAPMAEAVRQAPVEKAPVQPSQPVSQNKLTSLLKKTEAPRPAEKAPVPPAAPAAPVPPMSAVNAPKMPEPPKAKEKKSLFSGFGKKTKPEKISAPSAPAANPFGVNMPGAAPVPVNPAPAAPSVSAFPGINIPSKPQEQPKPVPSAEIPEAPAVAPMKIEEEEDTVFENQDEGTVFLGDASSRAALRDNTGASFEITGNVFTIGRSGKNSVRIDLDLPQKTVSHLHATIYNEGGRYFICDNNSANGTFLNNKRLNPNERCELTHGSRLRISNIDFTFEIS